MHPSLNCHQTLVIFYVGVALIVLKLFNCGVILKVFSLPKEVTLAAVTQSFLSHSAFAFTSAAGPDIKPTRSQYLRHCSTSLVEGMSLRVPFSCCLAGPY